MTEPVPRVASIAMFLARRRIVLPDGRTRRLTLDRDAERDPPKTGPISATALDSGGRARVSRRGQRAYSSGVAGRSWTGTRLRGSGAGAGDGGLLMERRAVDTAVARPPR